jgi:hypothetical protein
MRPTQMKILSDIYAYREEARVRLLGLQQEVVKLLLTGRRSK